MIKNSCKYIQNYILILIVVVFSYSHAFAGMASLSWDPPTANEDGTPLTDLSGYKIYYGTSSAFYTQNIDVGNVVTFTVTNLTDGLTYYFTVTAYDSSLNESDYSNEVSKTIPVKILDDINKDDTVDISDVILVLRIALQLDDLNPCSDINGDGGVDSSDVILSLRMALQLDPSIPCYWIH